MMYKNLAVFINKSEERIFNDSLMNVAATEISLKSGAINNQMILPRYYNRSCEYEGEVYERCGIIQEVLPNKALKELNVLVAAGSSLDFESKSALRVWIQKETGINDGSLSAIN